MDTARLALEDLVQEFARAWNERDAGALSAAYTEDGDFLDGAGNVWHGQAAIAAQCVRIFKQIPQPSMLRLQVAKAKLLSRGAAFVYATWSLTNSGSELPVRTGLWFFVGMRRRGAWRIACSQISTDARP